MASAFFSRRGLFLKRWPRISPPPARPPATTSPPPQVERRRFLGWRVTNQTYRAVGPNLLFQGQPKLDECGRRVGGGSVAPLDHFLIFRAWWGVCCLFRLSCCVRCWPSYLHTHTRTHFFYIVRCEFVTVRLVPEKTRASWVLEAPKSSTAWAWTSVCWGDECDRNNSSNIRRRMRQE